MEGILEVILEGIPGGLTDEINGTISEGIQGAFCKEVLKLLYFFSLENIEGILKQV